MEVFEIIIALLLGGAVLTLISRRLGAPYPALVALAGAALALVPGTPTLVLDPELALTLFVAPVLLDAAFDSSQRDLLANWRSVAGLAVGAVVLTVVAVAVVVRWLVPSMPWSVAIALGAIVAPPDAAAATAVLKQLKPPRHLLVVLEGESLFNDASALLIYRMAIGFAVAGFSSPLRAVPILFGVTLGSVLLGIVLSRVMLAVSARIEDVAVAVVVQFCSAFGIWMLAENLHLSGILTTVAFAMAVSRRASQTTPARLRIPSYAVWEFAVFVLNVLAFILIGFQLKGILGRIDSATLVRYLGIAAAALVAAVGTRIAYITGAVAFGILRHDRDELSGRAALVVGWCGMRGIVTLAAALALPTGEVSAGGFPHRDLILFISFAVVLGTLVVQGMTLRPLLGWLRLEDDGSVEREVRFARVETLRAANTALDALPPGEVSEVLRRRYALLLERTEAAACDEAAASSSRRARDGDATIVRAATSAERQSLIALRDAGSIGDEAFQRLEQELDLEELHLQQLTGNDS
jgi:CPA1 family monovalent cation:H+ antiporter